MPKQMSLSDLAKNAKSVQPPKHEEQEPQVIMEEEDAPVQDTVMDEKDRPVEIKSTTPVITPQQGKKGPNDAFKSGPKHKLNPHDIISAGIKSGRIKEKPQETVEDLPIVAEAFKSMKDRIERSKHDIDTIMMPVVMQNAQEIALENQMVQAEQQKKSDMAELEEANSDGFDKSYSTDPDDDFAELNDNTPSTQEPIPYQMPKIDPSERVYDIEPSQEEVDDTEPEQPIELEEEEMPKEVMPKATADTTPIEETKNVKPTLDDLLAESTKELEEVVEPVEEVKEEQPKLNSPMPPVETKAPKPTPTVEAKKPEKVEAAMPKAASAFHIESDEKTTSEIKKDDDYIIDMSGNKVSLAKAMEELDRDDDSTSDEDNVPETQEEIVAKFKKMFEKTKIIKDKVDLSKFTIRKKPVSSAYILTNVQNTKEWKKADWGLYFTHRPERYIETAGPELDNLRKTMNASNPLNSTIASIRFIYDHVDDANKPPFEIWCKLHRTEDLNSQFFGIYKATYADTNLIARTCTNEKCKKTSLIDTNIDDMVVYGGEKDDHEKIKAEFEDIMSGDTTSPNNAFKATLMQISDNFVVAYTPASLYTTYIQYSTLKEKFVSKYSDLLDMLANLETFFYIDHHTKEIVPIAIQEYPDSLTKTIMSKIQTFSGILKTLTSDQYNSFAAKVATITQTPKITYRFPKVICPECGKEIPEASIDGMLPMLFMRAQLAQIRNL